MCDSAYSRQRVALLGTQALLRDTPVRTVNYVRMPRPDCSEGVQCSTDSPWKTTLGHCSALALPYSICQLACSPGSTPGQTLSELCTHPGSDIGPAAAAKVHSAAVAQMPVMPADAAHSGTLGSKPLPADDAQSGRNVAWAAQGREAAAAAAVLQAASLIWQDVGSVDTCGHN